MGRFDIAWHRTIGRGSFFVLPHLFIYGGRRYSYIDVPAGRTSLAVTASGGSVTCTIRFARPLR